MKKLLVVVLSLVMVFGCITPTVAQASSKSVKVTKSVKNHKLTVKVKTNKTRPYLFNLLSYGGKCYPKAKSVLRGFSTITLHGSGSLRTGYAMLTKTQFKHIKKLVKDAEERQKTSISGLELLSEVTKSIKKYYKQQNIPILKFKIKWKNNKLTKFGYSVK